MKQNLPQTSDGEAEDQDRWKMSHHISEMPHLVSGDQPTNRAHKASAIAELQDRSKDAYNAGTLNIEKSGVKFVHHCYFALLCFIALFYCIILLHCIILLYYFDNEIKPIVL